MTIIYFDILISLLARFASGTLTGPLLLTGDGLPVLKTLSVPAVRVEVVNLVISDACRLYLVTFCCLLVKEECKKRSAMVIFILRPRTAWILGFVFPLRLTVRR